jgi:hypothetical protein
MRKLKPIFLKKSGMAEFVVLTSEDFEAFEEMIEDAGLSCIGRDARRRNADLWGISLAEMNRRLGMTGTRKRRAV